MQEIEHLIDYDLHFRELLVVIGVLLTELILVELSHLCHASHLPLVTGFSLK